MKQLKRYMRVYKRILQIAAMLLIEWRGSFFLWTIVHALELVVSVAFFQIVLMRTNLIGGWGIYEIAILLGYMEIMLALGGLTFYPMMYDFGEKIRDGSLDTKLVKPLDIQFLITFPWTDITDVFSILTGVFMMGYGISHLQIANLFFNFLAFLVLFASSLVILYSCILLLLTICFKTTQFDSVSDLYWTTLWIGKFPVSVFKGALQFLLIFIIPVGLVTSIPVRTLAGFFEPKYFFYSLVLALVLFIISRKVFLANIRHYSSASS